jgi:hypothetical protein
MGKEVERATCKERRMVGKEVGGIRDGEDCEHSSLVQGVADARHKCAERNEKVRSHDQETKCKLGRGRDNTKLGREIAGKR